MKRRFDIRQHTFAASLVVAVMYVLSTFVFSRMAVTAVPVIAGLLLFAANAVAVYLVVDFFSGGFNHMSALMFAILALSFPAVAVYDPAYLCITPLNAAFYIGVRFYAGDSKNDLAFFCSLLISLASLNFPPLAWVALFMLLMNFFPAVDKARFVVISIVGFLLPQVVALAVIYITGDVRMISPAVSDYLSQVVTMDISIGASSAARVIKVITFFVLFVVAFIAFLKHNAQYNVSHSKAMIMVYPYALLITLLVLLFPYTNLTMGTMLIMVPVAIVLYDYFVWGSSDHDCRIALAFALLAALLEYAFVGIK